METSEQTHLIHPASKIHPQGIGSPPIQYLKRSKPLRPTRPTRQWNSGLDHENPGQAGEDPLDRGKGAKQTCQRDMVRTKLTSKKNTIKGYYSKPKTQWTKRVTLRAMTHRWNKRHTTLNPRHNDTGGLNNRERRSYPRHGRQHKPLYQPCTKQGKVRNIGRRTSTNRHTHVWNGISNI